MKPRIALVIPCLNEAASIATVLSEVPRSCIDEIIVVDNGSSDGTGAIAASLGAQVVREERPGYGWACWSGLMAAQAAGAHVICYLDGDRSDHPAHLPDVLAPLLRGEADLVLGRRVLEPGALPPQAIWGNRVALALIWLLYGLRLHDIPSCRAIKTERLLALPMRERTYGWPVEMLLLAAKRGYRIVEVALPYRRRIGRSKVSGTLRGAVLAGYRMLATIFAIALRR